MTGSSVQVLIAMCCYMAVVIGIGIFFAKRANKNSENYFLGGRSLGPWVAAMSAEASDMSGWLLMGLPGLAYWCGLADAGWTAIGLAIGTYVNWLVVAKPLRRYSQVTNAITIPDFFSNRFKENKKVIMTIASIFILVFFAVYAGSCFVTCGKLFSQLFGANYQLMMVVGALFVLLYTFLGGFLAESASDFMQALVMIFALVTVLVTGTIAAGGVDAVVENAKGIPGFASFFGIAQPTLDAAGVQQIGANGEPLFGAAGNYGFLNMVSMIAWGLGYFGVPQVLLRFMAIEPSGEAEPQNVILSSSRVESFLMSSRKEIISARLSELPVRLEFKTAFPTRKPTENSLEFSCAAMWEQPSTSRADTKKTFARIFDFFLIALLPREPRSVRKSLLTGLAVFPIVKQT